MFSSFTTLKMGVEESQTYIIITARDKEMTLALQTEI
jgi:hypothetical protein